MAVRLKTLCWALLGLCLSAPAQSKVSLSATTLDELARHPQWLKLVHYEPTRFTRGVRSAIHAETFFLAEGGRTDPAAELAATLAALQAPVGVPDAHAQCRFPARNLWLRSQLPELAQQPQQACPDFIRWSGDGEIQSASLIFIEGYLGNPSSFFGHVLLRLNRDDTELDRPQLLATTLNFGVDLPSGEDPLLYFWRGTTGGYDAVFTQAQFHQHQLLYGDFQRRDLWEYQLALSPEQVTLLTAHSWELLGQDFRYYFTGANCAYRTATVLSVVLPPDVNLSNQIKPWTMPHDTFTHLMRAEQNGAPLVNAVIHHPAQYTQRVLAWRGLNATQRQRAQQWLRQPQPLIDLDELTPAQQAQLLDTLMLDQAAAARFADTYPSAPLWQALLAARATLPEQGERLTHPEAAIPQPVHAANSPTRLGLGARWQDSTGWGAELQFRVNYYDLLSRPVGRPALGELVLLDVNFAVFESGWQWQQVDLMRVTALNVSPSGLWQDQVLSSRFRVGYDPGDCAGCNGWRVAGGPGLAWGQPQHYALYAFLEGRLDTSELGPVAMTPQLGWLHHWHPRFSTHVEAGYDWQARQGDWGGQHQLMAGMRLGESARWDFRVNWRAEQRQLWQLQLGTHW